MPSEDDTLVLSPGIHLEVTFLDMFAKWSKMWLLLSSCHICPFLCLPARNNLSSTRWLFVKSYIWDPYENLLTYCRCG
jgi:hypothetical protein